MALSVRRRRIAQHVRWSAVRPLAAAGCYADQSDYRDVAAVGVKALCLEQAPGFCSFCIEAAPCH